MYQRTDRTTPSRARHRAHYDRRTVHAILDEAYLCHLGFVADGQPAVLPTCYARVGERIYLHGSTGSRPMLLARRHGGLPVCLEVTLVDGLVLSRVSTHHSVNYRSVVVHGTARPVTEPVEKLAALLAVVDQVVAGRSGDCRAPSDRELAATEVLALDLEQVSAKVRTGGPGNEPDEAELAAEYWGGVVPLTTVAGAPEPDRFASGQPPAYLAGYQR